MTETIQLRGSAEHIIAYTVNSENTRMDAVSQCGGHPSDAHDLATEKLS